MYTAAIYRNFIELESDSFLLRKVSLADADDLLAVYSDKKSIPLFNCDNCDGDRFNYDTPVKMREAINFWLFSYDKGYFVRWCIADKKSGRAIGTVELFNRFEADHFNNCAVLRIDLRSDYEKESVILELLALIVPKIKGLFSSSFTATKAISSASDRIGALEKFGFARTNEAMLGNGGVRYTDYFEFSL